MEGGRARGRDGGSAVLRFGPLPAVVIRADLLPELVGVWDLHNINTVLLLLLFLLPALSVPY